MRKSRPRAAIDWEGFRRDVAARLVSLGCPAAEAEAEAALSEERMKLRMEWLRERLDRFLEAQDAAGEAYCRMMDEHPDVDWEDPDAPELPEPPEQAVADSIYVEIAAARDHDRWPRHLHFAMV
jgi:hypothetical protein